MTKETLILASSSPRRLALLHNIAIYPDQIISPNINEQRLAHEKPEKMALRLANSKASLVASNWTKEDIAFILAADTIVATKDRIFDKAETLEDAAKYLQFFSGRRIAVHTAISVIRVKNGIIDKVATKLVTSDIKFKRINPQEMQNYLKNGNAIGSAGGFSIQGLGETLVQWISGSYSGIVGLPLTETINLLRGLGYYGNSQSKG